MAVSQTATVWPRKGTFILTAVSRSPDALFIRAHRRRQRFSPKKSIVDKKGENPCESCIFFIGQRINFCGCVRHIVGLESSRCCIREILVPWWATYESNIFLVQWPTRKPMHLSLIIINAPLGCIKWHKWLFCKVNIFCKTNLLYITVEIVRPQDTHQTHFL